MKLTRREFASLAATTVASLVVNPGCYGASPLDQPAGARLKARPTPNAKNTARGRSALKLGAGRDGVLQMPSTVPDSPLPLIVILHGAGGRAIDLVDWLGPTIERAGAAALSIDSRGPTWDAIHSDFGRDVSFMDRALAQVFEQIAVDPKRLTIGGFSDGATYGLSLGLINGDLFQRIVAFSPGFVIEGPASGRPRVFISHGMADKILPIDRCSRVIVPRLRQRGYDVTFREFAGGHDVPSDIAREGFDWASAV